MGEAIRRSYPFFYPDYSKTMEETYYANHCERCGALLGDHYLHLWMAEREDRFDNPDGVQPLPGIVEIEPATSYFERQFLPRHIHHVDGEPSNNSLENLQILCVDCHQRAHAERPTAERDSAPAL
jgi:hypothetical protein